MRRPQVAGTGNEKWHSRFLITLCSPAKCAQRRRLGTCMARRTVNIEADNFGDLGTAHRVSDGHAIYFRPLSEQVNLDTPIYRYIRLNHLYNLLDSHSLYVPNRSSFSDHSDRRGEDKYIPPTDSKYLRYKIEPAYSTPQDKRVKRDYDKTRNAAFDLCISCWSMEQEAERFLMWKAYRSDSLMCRIGTTIGKLIDHISIPHDIIVSDVSYGNSRSCLLADRLTFNKLSFYKDEAELRLAVLCHGKHHLLLDLKDPFELLDNIILSPFLDPKTEECLLSALRHRYAGIASKIQKSAIIEY